MTALPSFARLLAIALMLMAGLSVASAQYRVDRSYTVTGYDPYSQSNYEGTMRLTVRGAVFAYEGRFGSTVYEGVAVFDPDRGVLALQYRAPGTGNDGVGVYTLVDGQIRGRWSFMDDPRGLVGTEVWTPIN